MARQMALALVVSAMSAPAAWGQFIDIRASDGRTQFGSDTSFTAEVILGGFDELIDWQLTLDIGNAVTLANSAYPAPFDHPDHFHSTRLDRFGEPFLGWSKFIGPAVFVGGDSVLAATFDVTISGGDASNTRFAINQGVDETFGRPLTFVTGTVAGSGRVDPADPNLPRPPLEFRGLAIPGTVLVPEPTCALLLLAGAGIGALARCRRQRG